MLWHLHPHWSIILILLLFTILPIKKEINLVEISAATMMHGPVF